MNRLNLVLTCFMQILQVSNAEETADNLAYAFQALPLAKQTMANLPKGREKDVINALVKQPNRLTLLRLNHEPTVDSVISKYLGSKGKDAFTQYALLHSGSPYVIEKLAPILYLSDELIRRDYGEGVGDYGQSAAVAEVIGHLIMKAPEFSPEVRAWAKEHLDHPGEFIIQWGRLFWETNQAELKAQKFGDVIVPGPLPDSAPSGLREVDGGPPRSPKPEKTSERKIVLPESPSVEAPPWGIFWGILAGLLALAAVLWKCRPGED